MTLLKEKDYGTPKIESDNNVTGYIDGIEITVPEGTSIMRAAAMVGIDIPSLCASDNMDAFGSCRLCIVDFEGRKGFGYPSSCTTPLSKGMKVKTKNGHLKSLRKDLLEMYISDHPLDCNTCSADGDCDLQTQADNHNLLNNNQLVASKYDFKDGCTHLDAEVDASNPYFNFDPEKCIVCSKCVRACNEVQGTFALSVDSRGFESTIKPGVSDNFFDSECVSCGACVQACPTGSLIEKSVAEKGMPNETVLTTCAYCGVGCSFKAEVRNNDVVRMVPYKEGGANNGHSCIKGRFAWGYAKHKDRLSKPLIRDDINDDRQEVEWDEAIRFAARRLNEIQNEYGTNSIGGITTSKPPNAEA